LNDELALLEQVVIGEHALAKHTLQVAGLDDFPRYGLFNEQSVVECGDKFLEYTERLRDVFVHLYDQVDPVLIK
jgi:hypothetical protein